MEKTADRILSRSSLTEARDCKPVAARGVALLTTCAAAPSAGSTCLPLVDPHRHARLELRRRASRIGAQKEIVDVVVSDRTRRAPDRELTERSEFGDFGFETITGRGSQGDLRTHRQALKTVLADREREPAVAVDAERQDRLARRDRFAAFGDEEPRDSVDRGSQRRLGELSFEVGDRRLREGDLALRDREFFLCRSSLGLVKCRIRENETGLWPYSTPPRPRHTVAGSRSSSPPAPRHARIAL